VQQSKDAIFWEENIIPNWEKLYGRACLLSGLLKLLFQQQQK